MRHRIRFIIILLLGWSIVACDALPTTTTATAPVTTTDAGISSTTHAPLPVPYDIELDADELLSWTRFSPDCTYVVEVDGVETAVAATTFDMSSYPDGIYHVRIRTVLGSSTSSYSDVLTFTIRNHPDVPFALQVNDGTLSWDGSADAVGFRVRIGDLSFDCAEPATFLPVLPENALYGITVAALYPGDVVSEPSPPYLYHTYFTDLGSAEAAFDKNAPAAVAVDLTAYGWTVDHVLFEPFGWLEPTRYAIVDGILTIDEDAFADLAYGSYACTLLTTAGAFAVDVAVVDDRTPTMLSSSQVTFDGSDIVLTFQLYDGAVTGLSGNDVTADDYTIAGDVVTISAAYVAAKFAADPERTVLILGYTLAANDHVTIGYVFIRLPE